MEKGIKGFWRRAVLLDEETRRYRRRCSRCGRKLTKHYKLYICEGCRKNTLRQFLAENSVDEIYESVKMKRRREKPTEVEEESI
jgi:ribosomal protein S27AE